MVGVTRRPRVLVKVPEGQGTAVLSLGQTTLNVAGVLRPDLDASRKVPAKFEITPLFGSIGVAPGQGMAAPAQWHVVEATEDGEEVNPWDLCHALVRDPQGLGLDGCAPTMAEPDLEQQWVFGTDVQHALTLTDCAEPRGQDRNPFLRSEKDDYWFRDARHSQLEQARSRVTVPDHQADRVRIAHLDTGFDPDHITRPRGLRTDLARNFVDPDSPRDAADRSSGVGNCLGHGTGTLSILAGNAVDGVDLGGAPSLEVIPIRVADCVVLYRNSAIARGLDYVHELWGDPTTRAHVVTMSMGGVASAAWAEAVNALYELGVFMVTAAGNNSGGIPTRNIAYPARFGRVVAACGVMADGTPYADLPFGVMSGNYGPKSKQKTAMAAFTPNTPWARFGCSAVVDHNGRGTSAATPQIAAAAALWIQANKAACDQYSQGWMRVEAVRRALFESARHPDGGLDKYFGRGLLQADAALAVQPAAENALVRQPEDTASFSFLRVLTGLGVAPVRDAHQDMFELEALQLVQQSTELERLLHVAESTAAPEDQRRLCEALESAPGASKALRRALGVAVRAVQGPLSPLPALESTPKAEVIKRAMDPPVPVPPSRRLRVFAFDPLLGSRLDTMELNETTVEVPWEDLEPGPVGEYLEVLDVDPAAGVCYAPVDLNHPHVLAQSGLAPSETRPQFHQQMAYAVAMKTIKHFEFALGRVALWSARRVKTGDKVQDHFVRRLRVYPHAVCDPNAYYSPEKKALLFGYFPAPSGRDGLLPGQTIFCCLSHDIIAHETTHALLDGLHPRYGEATNADQLAFHEAFADIVALFQHFTMPDALRDQIARTGGDLSRQNMLGELAQQFGRGIGKYGALRNALGKEMGGVWVPATPNVNDYRNATEAHDRGAVLVAAVFEAFLNIYRKRSADLVRLATGGSGVLPEGAMSDDLVNRLAREASKSASHVLNMCIRALDHCPPVDIMFGEYVRALITADRDLVPQDPHGYRVSFIEAFRRRGIYPEGARNLSVEGVCWDNPEVDLPLDEVLSAMQWSWDLNANRQNAYHVSKQNAASFHTWLEKNMTVEAAAVLGFYREKQRVDVGDVQGEVSPVEVHSVRPVRRVGPDGQQSLDLLVEITQKWAPANDGKDFHRGGCTLIIGLESRRIRYCIRKRVAHPQRIEAQKAFRMGLAGSGLRGNYFASGACHEPFALLHQGG